MTQLFVTGLGIRSLPLSYQVIARRWRPQTFQELIGQDHVSRTLLNALKSERLPHALLFTGPRGVGKTSSARLLAKSLKCLKAKDFVPCNSCSVCEEIGAGSSLDVLEIDGASHNGVEAIRELRETVGYMPASGKYKIYIIDEVHMLSTSAFNALLKTLEEPPAHVVFIFATTEPQKIPVTILSRCQRFDFRRIPTRLIMEQLQTICDKEKVHAEPEALWVIARQSDGSLRDSQSLLDQIITFADKKITLQKTIEVLGLTDRALLLETLKSLVARTPDQAMRIVEKLYFTGCDSKVFLHELTEEIRHLLIIKMSGNERPGVVDLPDSEIDTLRELARDLSEEDIHLLFDMALKGGQDFLRAQDPRLVLEMLLLRMSQAPRVENILAWKTGAAPSAKENEFQPPAPSPESRPKSWAERVSGATGPAIKSAPTAKARPSQQKPPPAAREEEALSEANLPQRWLQFVSQLRRRSPSLGAKLEYVAPLSVNSNELTLGVAKDKKFLCEQLSDKKTLTEIESQMKAIWGVDLSLKCQILDSNATTSPIEIKEKMASDKNAEIRTEVEQHPLIQKAQKAFKAQIKNIREETAAGTAATKKGDLS